MELKEAIDLLLAKVGLLTAVHKAGNQGTCINRGLRLGYRFKKAADEETLQGHDIPGFHGSFWYLLRNIASERYCRASREGPNSIIDDVLKSFFFKEKDMFRARPYAVPTYIGAGLMAKAKLNARAANSKKHQSRENQWYTPSLIAVGFSRPSKRANVFLFMYF